MRLSPITMHRPGDRSLRAGNLGSTLAALIRDRKGVSVLELAVSAPVFIFLCMFGLEIAYMAVTNLQVSQIAAAVADNSSRLGQTDNSGMTPTVSEGQIDVVMGGALRQGTNIDFEQNGRIVLSSLEVDGATDRQYIHWQRCSGNLDRSSDYGTQGTGLSGEIIGGMGKTGRIIQAAQANTSAVMFAEVFYEHRGIFGDLFIDDVLFKEDAAFEIRDDRNLGPGVTGGGGTSSCG